MSSRARLSVIIPIRDRSGARLANCLRSLRWQSVPASDLEILVSDFGSSPAHRRSIVESARDHGARVVTTGTAELWNRSRALNIGLQTASAEHVLCTDADMLFAPDFIEVVLTELDRAGRLPLVVCRCWDLPATLQEQAWQREDFARLRAQATLRPTGGTGACQATRRSWLESVRGYDEKYVFWGFEDTDMLKRAQRCGLKVRWIQDRTSMLHQWHPRVAGERPLLKYVNKLRFYLTRHRVEKNPDGWGTRR